MEIARKVAKKMRIEHAQESHITTTQARSRDMKRLKRVCEYAYKETMRLGLARMKDKTLPNVRISHTRMTQLRVSPRGFTMVRGKSGQPKYLVAKPVNRS